MKSLIQNNYIPVQPLSMPSYLQLKVSDKIHGVTSLLLDYILQLLSNQLGKY